MWLLLVFLIVHQVLRVEGFASAVQEEAMDEPETSSNKIEEETPGKRNLVQFAKMTKCATGIEPVEFVAYGCWCGRGGEGKVVDEVDRCCYRHDKCYGRVEKSGVCGTSLGSKTIAVYSTTYKTDKDNCTVCVPMSAYKKDDYPECRYRVCRCDSKAVHCFAKAEFHEEYIGYSRKNECSKKKRKQ